MGILHDHIEYELSKIKQWYLQNYPLCVFCGHRVRKHGDLAHLIRRSYSMDMMAMKLNTGLAHRNCHECFDNDPVNAVYLPRILEVLYIIWLLDRQYFSQISESYPIYNDLFGLFPVHYDNYPFIPDHHGEVIQLWYLV